MADLKNENPNAVKYFRERGRRYFELREDLKRFQLTEIELGDLSIEEIRKIGAIVQARYSSGGIVEVEKLQRIYEKQASIFEAALADFEHTPLEDMPKIQVNKDKAETMLNLINMFKNISVRLSESRTQAETAVKTIDEARRNLTEASKNIAGDGIVPSVDQFKKAINSFEAANGAYESAAYAYNQATLQELPELGLKVMPLTDLKELYIVLRSAIKYARLQEPKDPSKAPKIHRNLVALEEAVDLIESRVDKQTLDLLIASVDDKFKEDERSFEEDDKKKAERAFLAQLSAAYNAMLNAFKAKYSSKDWNSFGLKKAISDKDQLLREGFEDVPVETKLAHDATFAKSYKELLQKYYGEALYAAIGEVENIIGQIEALNKLNPEDKSLAAKVEAVMGQIARFKESQFVKEGGVVITQGENSVEFKFADEKVSSRRVDRILSDALYEKLHPKKDETPEDKKDEKPEEKKDERPEDKKDEKPEEKKDETPAESEARDIKFYLDLLKETNAKVEEVNRINKALLVTTQFSDMNLENLRYDVKAENSAVYTSAIITQLRIQLSDKRYEFLKKYGKYIVSTPEVKEAKIDEIKFDAEIDDFLAKHDELIVDAEREIVKLMKEKPEKYEERVEVLKDFIKAQNSLIRRFLISESITKDIDIAAILEARNARKAELHRQKDLAEQQQRDNEPDVQPDVKPDTRPDEKPNVQPDVKPDTRPDEKPDVQPDVKPDTRPDEKPDEKPDTRQDEEPEEKPDEKKPNGHSDGKPDEEPEEKPDEKKPDEVPFEPVPKGTTVPHVLIKNTVLLFNPRNNRKIAKKISANDRLFTNSPKVTTTLIKNGVRIQLSKQVRERLAELGAKLSLVNKENKRIRTSQLVDGQAESQDLVFKKDHDVNFEDYAVEVRIPNGDKSAVIFGDEELHRSR